MDIKELLAKAGGAYKVAAEIDVASQWVYQWKQVPAKHVVAVSRLSGVPPEQIRPDIFAGLRAM